MKKSSGGRKGRHVMAIVIFVLCTATSFAQVLGDVNGNGAADIIDAMLIAQYYVGNIPAVFDTAVADTNCSGTIDIIDALRVAQFYVGTLTELSCGNATPAPTAAETAAPGTPAPTAATGDLYTGVATWFTGIGGTHYGGCGLPQAILDTQNHVALNVQDTPGDYTTRFSRPIAPEYAASIGMFDNGLNCGRWVRVVIGDYCNGVNDGAQNEPFCRGGDGWVTDAYNGAELNMVVGDSCQDDNAWCRDSKYHLDLSRDALNKFVKNGVPVGDMEPDHWNNRQVHWEFIEAPNYSGDIRIGFMKDAQAWWSAIAVTHLRNGIHGVDYYDGSSWVKATMNSDMGNSYIVAPTTPGGTAYRIRVYDAADTLINSGRTYSFSFPSSCGSACAIPFTEVSYTTD
jgi:expansin (peptidoglycan-binding protein)